MLASCHRAPGLALAVALLFGAAVQAGDDVEEEAKAALELVHDGVDDRRPDRVQQGLKALDGLYDRLSERTLKKVRKAVLDMFKEYELRISYDLPLLPPQPGEEEPLEASSDFEDVLDCFALAVGLMHDKPRGDEVLLSALKVGQVKKSSEMKALILEGLGYRHDPALIPTFADYLEDEFPDVGVAAANALRELFDTEHAVRRAAAEPIIDAYEKITTAAIKEERKTGEDDPRPMGEHLARITVPFGEALKALTRQSYDDADGWASWWKQHGKEDGW